MHETLRIAYEKGQPVPQEIIEALQSKELPHTESTPERDLRRGLVLVAWGLGLALLGLGLWYGIDSNTIIGSDQDNASYIVGACTAGAGGIPGMIGVAYLILWWTKRNAPKA
jgi:hypothetical protein